MAGKGGKGLLAGKTTAAAAAAANKEKDKKRPVSRSSRAGLQVMWFFFNYWRNAASQCLLHYRFRFGCDSFSVEGF